MVDIVYQIKVYIFMPYMNQSDNIFVLEDRHDLIYAGIHIFSWHKYDKYVHGYLKSVIWRMLNAATRGI